MGGSWSGQAHPRIVRVHAHARPPGALFLPSRPLHIAMSCSVDLYLCGTRLRISSLTHIRSCDTAQPTFSSFLDDPIATLPFVQHSRLLTRPRDPEKSPPSVTLTRTKGFHHNFAPNTVGSPLVNPKTTGTRSRSFIRYIFSLLLLIEHFGHAQRAVKVCRPGSDPQSLDLVLMRAECAKSGGCTS